MDYEKKYKEALGWMQSVYPTMTGADKEDAEHFFPELKESEDDRTRKEIVSAINIYCSEYHRGTKVRNDMLDWLEKKGEQHPKFRIGDTIKKESTGDIVTISEIDLKNREYRLSNTGFIPFKYEHLWELVEQKPNPCDGCINRKGCINCENGELTESEDEKIRKAIIEFFELQDDNTTYSFIPKKDIIAWLEKQEEQKTVDEIAKEVCKNRVSATTFLKSAGIMNEKGELAEQYRQDEQTSYASKTMNEKGDFDNGFTRMMEKEQTPAWGEKDKKMLRFIGNAITADDASMYLKSKGIQVIDAHVWLEELKDRVQPQLHWKPSDEQITWLYRATDEAKKDSRMKQILKELLSDLKKLREE